MTKNRIPDEIPHIIFLSITIITVTIMSCFIFYIFYNAYPIFASEGIISFITGTQWDYGRHIFGIRNYVGGTVIVTFVTLLFAVPVGVLTAIFLSEFAPIKLSSILRPLIELLVGIPSVVYGIFGLFILEPIFRNIIPIISKFFFFLPFFEYDHPGRGAGVFLASIILAVMIIPTIITVSEDSLRAVAKDYRDASFALGATRWETVRFTVLPAAYKGVVSSIVLGMMRATGETMAVVMLIGGANQIPSSIFDLATPITTKILYDAADYIGVPVAHNAIFSLVAFLFIIDIFFVGVVRKLMKRGG